MRLSEFPILLCSLVIASILPARPAWSQTENKLSAREIFYSAPAEPPAAAKAAPQPAATPKKKAAVETAKAKPAVPAPAPAADLSRIPAEAEVIPASYTAGEAFPLGVRYSVLRREGAEPAEVSPDAVFHSGDRIQLRVEVNASGYLYIIHRGSSGIWKPLFPSPEIAAGDNRVQKGKAYDIPSGYVFTFDEQPGEEKLFIVFSRQPELDLEGLIYSLSSPQPPAEPAPLEAPKVLLAQNLVNINDGFVDKLRQVYARDLIIEKADEASSPGPAREKAVYVANPSRSGDSRVVADVTLNHQ